MSVSRWIGEKLARERDDDEANAKAIAELEDFWANGPKFPLSENGKITIDRDEMYGERFRRFDHDPLPAGPERAREGGSRAGVAEDADRYKDPPTEPPGSE
jgi:hypothetical protein